MSELLLWIGKLFPQLALPVPLVLLLLLAALLAGARSAWRRRLLLAAAGTLFVTASPLFGRAISLPLERAHPPLASDGTAPVIVLLGGATQPALAPRTTVELGEEADRVIYAARLWHEGRAPRILVCGGRLDPSDRAQSEAREMAGFLRLFGVPEDAIVLEERSRTTWENGVEARRVLAQLGATRVLLVTSAMHMPRSVGVFRAQGIEVVPAPTDFRLVDLAPATSLNARLRRALAWTVPSASALAHVDAALHEWLGMLVYWLQGRLG